MTTDIKIDTTKESACICKRFLICCSEMVTPLDKRWNTIYLSLLLIYVKLVNFGLVRYFKEK